MKKSVINNPAQRIDGRGARKGTKPKNGAGKGRRWDAKKPRNKGLISDRHMLVIDEYEKIQFASQKQALINAGYSPATAGSGSWQVFHRPEVIAEIERRRQKRRLKIEVTEDMVMNRLRIGLMANPGEILQKLVESNWDIAVLTEEEKYVVHEFSQTETRVGKAISIRTKAKIESGLKACELLMRKLGMMKDKLEVTAPGMDVASLLQQGRQRMGEKSDADGAK